MKKVYPVSGRDGTKEFNIFFDKYAKRLYNIACRHVAPDDAEDIIQELFIEIWEKRNTIKIHTTWDGYLYTALKYKIFKFLDRQNERNLALRNALNEIGKSEEILSFEELYATLDESISQLSPKTRSVLEKKYFENKKLAEIASELEISVETVKSHLKRGIKVMRAKMNNALVHFLFL